MSVITTIGLDLAKTTFQVHGAGRAGQVMLRKKLRRDQVLSFLRALPPCPVAEGSHLRRSIDLVIAHF